MGKRTQPGMAHDYFFSCYRTPEAHDPGWIYYLRPEGYGLVWYQKKLLGTHTLACFLAHGPAPEPGMYAAHECSENRGCFYAEHLSWKTPVENSFDMLRDGTMHQAKLTEADVIQIRMAYQEGVVQETLAGAYGVAQATISAVVRGRTWKHLLLTMSFEPCEWCGTWVCNDCGWRRAYAARHSEQYCTSCKSLDGKFTGRVHSNAEVRLVHERLATNLMRETDGLPERHRVGQEVQTRHHWARRDG